MARKKITDQRIIEACEGRDVDMATASPRELVEAYAGWTLGDPSWAGVFLSVMENAGLVKRIG